jgi:response regulator RpfG family c-di-GMP phosphodiesterase
MKKPRLPRKSSNPEPKLHPTLRPHLLEAMMHALQISEMARKSTIQHLERIEKESARLAERTTGEVQALSSLAAEMAQQHIASLKMAADSADVICKCLGKLAQ